MAGLCCPECGSNRLYKDGLRYLSDGSTVQRWLCRNCGYRFSQKSDKRSSDSAPFVNKFTNNKCYKTSLNQSSFTANAVKQSSFGANAPSGKGGKSFKNCPTNSLSDAHGKKVLVMEVEKAIGEKREAGATESAQQDVKGKIVELLWQLERNGRTQGTIANYRKTLMRMFRENVDLNDPEECKAWLSKKEFAANTKRNIATILDKWFEYLGVAWVKPSYCGEPEIPFIPTEQELDCLIASVGKKMACYLQLLKDTGARCGEISNLKWTDVDFEQRTVRVKGEKGSYSRMLPISVKAVEMLKNLPKTEDHIFADANHMRACFYVQRKRASRKLGNPRLMQITFHTFRHWKGTMLYHQTKDIYHVKEYLGHKNLQSTQVYIHIEKAMFRTMEPDEYHVKVAETKEDIIALLEEGFEFVMEKDGFAYFRKRK